MGICRSCEAMVRSVSAGAANSSEGHFRCTIYSLHHLPRPKGRDRNLGVAGEKSEDLVLVASKHQLLEPASFPDFERKVDIVVLWGCLLSPPQSTWGRGK